MVGGLQLGKVWTVVQPTQQQSQDLPKRCVVHSGHGAVLVPWRCTVWWGAGSSLVGGLQLGTLWIVVQPTQQQPPDLPKRCVMHSGHGAVLVPCRCTVWWGAGSSVVGGLHLGNVWIGVQPALGLEGDPMRLLFERDLTPHPQYAAFYKWLHANADAVCHLGACPARTKAGVRRLCDWQVQTVVLCIFPKFKATSGHTRVNPMFCKWVCSSANAVCPPWGAGRAAHVPGRWTPLPAARAKSLRGGRVCHIPQSTECFASLRGMRVGGRLVLACAQNLLLRLHRVRQWLRFDSVCCRCVYRTEAAEAVCALLGEGRLRHDNPQQMCEQLAPVPMMDCRKLAV